MACEDELTMIPMKLTRAKTIGIDSICDITASEGLRAREPKSGAFVMIVDWELMHDVMLATIAHPRGEPWIVAGWWTIGPTPRALMIHQIKKVIPAIGTMIDLTVNKCRTWCMGNQIAGSETSQNRKKHMKSRVVVPEEGGKVLGMF